MNEKATWKRRCLLRHRWRRTALICDRCERCGWGRVFTGYDFIWYSPAAIDKAPHGIACADWPGACQHTPAHDNGRFTPETGGDR